MESWNSPYIRGEFQLPPYIGGALGGTVGADFPLKLPLHRVGELLQGTVWGSLSKLILSQLNDRRQKNSHYSPAAACGRRYKTNQAVSSITWQIVSHIRLRANNANRPVHTDTPLPSPVNHQQFSIVRAQVSCLVCFFLDSGKWQVASGESQCLQDDSSNQFSRKEVGKGG